MTKPGATAPGGVGRWFESSVAVTATLSIRVAQALESRTISQQLNCFVVQGGSLLVLDCIEQGDQILFYFPTFIKVSSSLLNFKPLH